MINADALETWTRAQHGLMSKANDWVSFHRNMGGDTERDGVLYSNNGTSEVVMRNQFKAWRNYMAPAYAKVNVTVTTD
jgi:2-chlorobenzoate 1,2-dioxygenase